MRSRLILPIVLGAMLAAWGEESSAVDFEKDIEPIFQDRCFDCHGPDKQKGKFRLDRRATLLKGGDSGEPAVVPKNPAGSFLLKLIRHQEPDLEMPPKGAPLSAAEISLIQQWIAAGAGTPDHYGPDTEKLELTHWSFKPVLRPETAEGIDGFIRRKLSENGLKLSPGADRRTLIRRLYLVMLGLPPTPEQVNAFVADESEAAWQELVNGVLASPRYGERWASHWLDLVRFGETNGFETNRERPNAWHFRDWVIDSFNRDKPYDQFVREQIAGDAVGADIGTGFLVAGPYDTVKGQDPKLRLVQRMNELDDMINTTGTAFLGLTLGCARCHNHKFDPVTQTDYYSLQAIFAGVNHADRALPLTEDTMQEIAALESEERDLIAQLVPFIPKVDPDARPAINPRENTETFPPSVAKLVRFTIDRTNRATPCIDELQIFDGNQKNIALASAGAKATSSGDFEHPLHKLEHINDGQFGNAKSWIAKAIPGGWVQIEFPEATEIHSLKWGRDKLGKYTDRIAIDYRIEAKEKPDSPWKLLASSASRQPFKEGSAKASAEYDFTNHSPDKAARGRELKKRLDAARAEIKTLKESAKVYAGTFSQPGPTHRLYRGEPEAKREEVGPDGVAAFASLNLKKSAPEQQRRVALAEWIASPDNPLTARVIANRLWQFHFGTGIVDTPSDFGINGTAPTHPELLDWLASELMANGWSLKHLHRLILNSATWRQNHLPDAEAMRVDASTRLLWRFPPRRLEAEGIRDSILAASGVLDLEKMGGPGFSAFEVEQENVRHYHPKKSYGPEDWRRMIYMTKVRQEKDVVFGAFDCPDASMVVPKRSRSTTPLQALNLLNSPFVLQQAELFAKRLERETKTKNACVERAWQLCFQRPPAEAEMKDSIAFIESDGLLQFARAMLNANEFVFIP